MLPKYVAPIVTALLLTNSASSLEVAPGSPCTSLCLDPNQSAPSTSGQEIACRDESFNKTVPGQKFKSCLSCLQKSTFTGSSGDDQRWFLYNMRYALSACLFDFGNSSDALNNPCSTGTACEPLKMSFENANLYPPDETTYAYCDAADHAMMGVAGPKCESCLHNSETKYLGNFAIALKAGCNQRAVPGMMVGLSGSVFSEQQVVGTFAGDNPNAPKSKKKIITTTAIVGIVIGAVVLILIVLAALHFYFRRWRTQRRKRLDSGLDERFGAPTITSPNAGAYGNPYAFPYVNAAPLHSMDGSITSENGGFPDSKSGYNKEDLGTIQQRPTHLPLSKIPTHKAYIPPSPTESHSTRFSISPLPSAKSSPEYPSHLLSPNSVHTAKTSPFPSPRSQNSHQYPPPIFTQGIPKHVRNGSNTMTSPLSAATGHSRNLGGRRDFELAERERREREANGEVIAPLVKKKGGSKTVWDPHSAGSDVQNNLW
ncbi:hypothetical protein BJ875DRAFT_495141 [Amylocarpus encephaloides]|uniref:LPXTG-domain-containing protein n=1 Tax=Amylocarpus encephaloides TaxID=45428 RepID=A0A9P7YLN6_9HELO|nr:hypothetical protein BJ875DRAFT_495141 [Amylocarpus encephaloides]